MAVLGNANFAIENILRNKGSGIGLKYSQFSSMIGYIAEVKSTTHQQDAMF